MGRSCMNCARRRPFYDGEVLRKQVCGLDPEMQVNGRMHCEEWLYGGPMTVSVSDVGHEKYTVNGKGTRRGK